MTDCQIFQTPATFFKNTVIIKWFIYGDYKRVFRNCQEKNLKKASSEDEAP